ncbi:hypothetical protein RIF29_29820 [Crotalaria pallida]|uniref:Uncharacterized protein n=1 Tax=Crotalaria pallida TaxID=3830 RepID=A0AAN9EFH1_CROPI
MASDRGDRYMICSSSGKFEVKGKADPQKILLKLIKAGKHATILQITYGLLPKDNQNQPNKHAENALSHLKYPYEIYHQQPLLPYNYLQSGMNYIQPGPGNEHSGHNEKRNSSHSHHDSCPVHPRNRRQHQHSPPQNYSPPSKHSGVNGIGFKKPASGKSNRIFNTKVIEKLRLPCFSLCCKE